MIELPEHFRSAFLSTLGGIFGANLLFGFVFGSFAKGYATFGHDIDTFVCLETRNSFAERGYLVWLENIHDELGLVVDKDYPAEIVCQADLEHMLKRLKRLRLALNDNESSAFDYVVWTEALAGPKRFMVGDERKALHYERRCVGFPEKWRLDILQSLIERGDPRAKLCQERDAVYMLRKIVCFESNAKPCR